MKVPCIKGYELIEKDFGPYTAIKRKWVTMYNDICDSCDICKDKSCIFYDDTAEGTRKYIEGSHEARLSVEGILEEKENTRFFIEFYDLQL